MFFVFTKHPFSNLCSDTGLFETSKVKIYMNKRMIKTERRGNEMSMSERGRAGRKIPKIKYSALLYKLSYRTKF